MAGNAISGGKGTEIDIRNSCPFSRQYGLWGNYATKPRGGLEHSPVNGCEFLTNHNASTYLMRWSLISKSLLDLPNHFSERVIDSKHER